MPPPGVQKEVPHFAAPEPKAVTLFSEGCKNVGKHKSGLMGWMYFPVFPIGKQDIF